MEFRETTLKNGLEIIAECDERSFSTAVGFFVKAGSRDENDENSGVSHFLEHMVFKGTPKRTAEDVNRELDEMGSYSNAYTSEEHTCYYAVVLPEFQNRVVELLSDILRPSLRDEDFNTEKKVIIEEILKYEDQPPYGAMEKCMAAHFGSHPLSRSVLGTEQSVGGLTPQMMKAYFEQRYSPSNIVLVATGRVDFDALVAAAEEHCGAWATFDAPRKTPRAPRNKSMGVMYKENSMQEYIIRVADGPAAEDEDRYAVRILSAVLGDDSGSRYYWEFIDSGAAEYAAVASYEYQGTGALMTFLCCAPEEAAANLDRLEQLEKEMERSGVTEEELSLAKNKICSHIVLQSERAANRLFSVGGRWIQHRKYRTLRESLDKYQAVTREQVAAAAKKYAPSYNTTIAVGPLTSLAGVSA